MIFLGNFFKSKQKQIRERRQQVSKIDIKNKNTLHNKSANNCIKKDEPENEKLKQKEKKN